MRHEYPYFVNNIPELLQWFDRELKDKKGKRVPPKKFPYLGGRISRFMKKENLTIDEFKTILWGVMNEHPKAYSPIYATYFVEKLNEYQDLKKDMEEKRDKPTQKVEFNKEFIEETKEEAGDDFFESF